MSNRTIRIGTRGSKLALIQTEMVEKALKEKFPNIETERVIINTKADKDRVTPLPEFKGSGVVAKELEYALISGEIDIAVHSAKDMSVNIPEDLRILATLVRADVRDVLVYRKDLGENIEDIKGRIIVGTDSPRRQYQLNRMYPLFECKSIRGNVPTRVDKVKNKEYDATLLAAAGLIRLNLLEDKELNYHFFDENEILPAGGQAIIAIEGRTDDEIAPYIEAIKDEASYLELMTEQKILRDLNAGCHEPLAVRAKVEGDMLSIDASKAFGEGDELVVRAAHQEGDSKEYVELAERIVRELTI